MASIYRAYKSTKLPKNYFRLEINILRFMGLELMTEESPGYKLYSRSMMFYCIYFVTFVEVYEVYGNWGDLNALVDVLNYGTTHFLGGLKLALLLMHRVEIGDIVKSFHRAPFAPDASRGGSFEEISVRNLVRKMEKQYVVFCSIIAVVVFSGIIHSVHSRIFDPIDKWHLPYFPVTLIDATRSPYFEIAFLYQATCIPLSAIVIASVDFLLNVIMAHLSLQMKILQNSFRCMNTKIDVLRRNDSRYRRFDHYAAIIVRDSINYHLKILELAGRMEKFGHVMFLVIMLTSVLQLCFLLYQTYSLPVRSVVFIQNFCYYWIIFGEVGMNFYWGNEVTVEAANVANAAIDFDWTCLPPRLSKSLVLIIRRSQKPVQLTAGKFVPLSLATFMRIVKGSLSYFMVMRQRREDE